MRVAVLSPLPAVAGQPPESGVAAYTAALIRSMNGGAEITVLAQKHATSDRIGHARVTRAWTPNIRLPSQLIKAFAGARPEILHVQHEFNLYGGLIQGALVTLTVLRLRRRGVRVVTTIHGVVAPDEVTRQFVVRNGLPRAVRLVRAAFRVSYRGIDASSDLLIVHHEHFRNVLEHAYGIDGRKVIVIPPGAPEGDGQARSPRNGRARQILALGFLTGYKLPEILVDVAELDAIPGATFNFCIGANPRITDRAYQDRYIKLERRVRALGSRARWQGYVPDAWLPATLAEADVLVLPYTECVSVSAVAALARASQTPICYSRPLEPLFGPGPLEFELNPTALAQAISKSFSTQSNPVIGGFTSWSDAASATQDAWRRVLAPG